MKYQGAMLQLFGTLVTACIEKKGKPKPKSLYCRKIKVAKMMIMLCHFPPEKSPDILYIFFRVPSMRKEVKDDQGYLASIY